VIEATGAGVVYTPFEKWKSIGRDERWAAYRVKAKYRKHVGDFLRQLHPHAGKPYDFSYDLSEDKLYCSELVYHAWAKATGQKMGTLTELGDLNWRPFSATIEKYNGGLMPPDRQLISPVELSKAPQLERVYNHGLDHD